MLKITGQCGTELGVLTLLLEGRLAGAWVDALRTYCREVSANRQQCAIIDLTGVTFVDAEGKALLSRLWQEGAELRAAGCLTKCVVEEITGARRTDPSSMSHDR